ncbi:MAG: DJ-1/PfpI family protein [Candidatus Riflebacteria bacterium]|nr:DJ-1/PfpI family protein [Candidatus Riflebacteria bacterium]
MLKRMLVFLVLVFVATVAFSYEAAKPEEVDAGMPYTVAAVPVAKADSLKGMKIAIVAAHGFEQIEVTYPLEFLKARGAQVDVISPDWIKGRVLGVQFLKPSVWIPVTHNISEVKPGDYCALLVPGGAWNPIIMRTDAKILDFIRGSAKANKLIASICHGPQVLISAGLVKGREITGVGDIRTDLANAGGQVVHDQPLIVDGNILTSRDPNDLAQFCQGIEAYMLKNSKFCKSQEMKPAEGSKPAMEIQASMEEMQPSGSRTVCPDCKGTGRVFGGPGYYPYACPHCNGTGYITSNLPPVSTDH